MSTPDTPTPRPGRKLHEALAPAWRQRKTILIVALGLAVVTAIVNFVVLDLTYKASASLLPETEKSKLGMMSQFSGLAQLAGVSVPGSDVARLYPIILSSETVLLPVIETKYKSAKYSDSVDLVRYFDLTKKTREENLDLALRELRGRMTTSFDAKTSSVVVTAEMEEPQLAADVLNGVIQQLDLFMRQKRITTASEQGKWISTRLSEVEKELRNAEDALKVFRERNRRVSDSPELLLMQERLLREIKVKSTVYEELKKQFELAKIEEIKNTTIVNVLDPARAPVKKEHPKRATNTAIAFVLGLVVMTGWYSMKPVYEGRVKGFIAGIKGEDNPRL
jgi:tyrosine-protein kinase Etk/Wzc